MAIDVVGEIGTIWHLRGKDRGSNSGVDFKNLKAILSGEDVNGGKIDGEGLSGGKSQSFELREKRIVG